ncbi:hypothetical protein SAMN04244553_1641 [Nocardia amikacinitolerans]|uniref:Uncharacterized protein n=1 Tax=Nocardia amikacinitolerans TaxID=756689 RepID=A0A285L3R3_9NOCA|nr:hypothetical protein [Nocardia amikacinitolerans]MCP2277902.1 hypothetical protein [Nocardia amikacinitolerans]MCP2297760.1 hypothetical protein [Nocardia amikacinitolerans]MCP2315512.1 hypothetical protein [Nocardia amikacinitolerans]SNY79545.1 hypothetical protein SAMN04244553_1641 [Nocardia amikacinitolerans]
MSTSFRVSESAGRRLVARAAQEGTSSTALLNRLIREGVDQLEHPGIVFRGPIHDRRAALAAGPEIWEVVARLLELEGPVEQRITVLSGQSDLQSRKIRAALAYAREYGVEIGARIGRNRQAAEAIQRGEPI